MTTEGGDRTRPRPSPLARVFRTVLRALLIAFAVGLSIGTLIRCEAERSTMPPLQYLGERAQPDLPAESARAA